VAEPQQLRRVPREGRALRGPTRLVSAARHGDVLRHDPQARPGGCRATSELTPVGGCACNPWRTPRRPPAYIRGAPAFGGHSLHAGIEVVGAQYLYPDARHLRRLHPRAGRRGGEQPARAASPGAQQCAGQRGAATATRVGEINHGHRLGAPQASASQRRRRYLHHLLLRRLTRTDSC
jgi:hypothetical protein